MRPIADMVVVVTGASAGIGLALARKLHSMRANLVLAARRSDRLEALNIELDAKHLTVQTDVSRREDCENLIERSYKRFGRIDTLVCNAGFGLYYPVDKTTPQQMRQLFATNVFGTTDCIYAALPRMIEQPRRAGWCGQVMIVSSAAARRGTPYLGPYSATKAAQLSIAEALRVEMAPRHIAVTSVHPIVTKTDFGKTAEESSGVRLPKGGDAFSQPVGRVVNAMVAGIAEPRPEVWTSLPTRVGLAANALFPSAGDALMREYRRRVEAANQTPAPNL